MMRRTSKAKDELAEAPGWRVQTNGHFAALKVSGDWIAQSGQIPDFPPDGLDKIVARQKPAFTMTGAGRWDSGLIAFLWDARRAAGTSDIAIDDSALPEAARKLLGLLADTSLERPAAGRHRRFLLEWIGGRTLALLSDLGTTSVLLGKTVRAGALALFGGARVRAVDVLANLRDAGPAALLIVSVVNFLVGGILAFVGAAQLSKFAAGVYVANLAGVALVHEIGPVRPAQQRRCIVTRLA